MLAPAPAIDCLSEDDVLAFVADGAGDRAAIEHHLDGCAECMELVTLAAQTSIARGSGAPPPVRTLLAHSHVGRYEIEEPRGRGAMGTVYAALDTQLDRRVAVKLVEPGDDRAQVALLREAKALARVAHPNVLAVHDFGVFETHVFLVAELVDGESLAAWGLRTHPWREIAEVYLAAARGLAAAHAAGLVHRDFKPANVLIGKDGRVRVCDFGLARFTDTAPTTKELVGTPVYMAPEQRRGEVADARADQYALCVALHEALHGVLPPARGDRGIPSWLATIIARGLAEAPADRFPTMIALAAALERGLHRRRRAAVAGMAAAGVASAALIAVIAYRHGGTDLGERCPAPSLAAWSPAHRLAIQQAFAATRLPFAPALASAVTRKLDRFDARFATSGRDACLAVEVLHTDDRTIYDRRTACLEQARVTFGAIVERLGAPHRRLALEAKSLIDDLPDLDGCIRPSTARTASPELVAAGARIQALAIAGDFDVAEHELMAATKAAEASGDPHEVARAHFVAAQFADIRGRADEAAHRYEAVVYEAQAAGDDPIVSTAIGELVHTFALAGRDADVQRVRALALATAERIATLEARARMARAVGHADLVAGRYSSAAELLARARALEEARNPRDNYELAAVLSELGDLAYRRGELAKAEPLQRQALAMFTEELGPAHPTLGAMANNLANTLADEGKFGEARELYARALENREGVLGPNHPDVAQTLNNMAGVALQSGDLAGARHDLERALAIYRGHPPIAKLLVASVINNLGELASADDRVADAIALHQEALALRRAAAPNHPAVIESQLALAGLALRAHDLAGARRHCEGARDAAAHADPGAAPPVATLDTCFAELELADHHPARAVPLLEHALAHAPPDADPGEQAVTQFALARALDHGSRALELAHTARAAFDRDGALRKRELAEVDAWLASRS